MNLNKTSLQKELRKLQLKYFDSFGGAIMLPFVSIKLCVSLRTAIRKYLVINTRLLQRAQEEDVEGV